MCVFYVSEFIYTMLFHIQLLNIAIVYYLQYLLDIRNICKIFQYSFINGWFLERKICNPLVNVADRLKKLRGSGQPYLVNVNISAYVVHFFLGNIYSRGLKFLQVICESLDCNLTQQGFLIHVLNKNMVHLD